MSGFDRRKIPDEIGSLVMHDPDTGQTSYAIQCYRCRRHSLVRREVYERYDYTTCRECKEELNSIHQPTGDRQ